MTTLSILNLTKRLNAAAINAQEIDIKLLRTEAKAWKEQEETAFFVSTCEDIRRKRAKLVKMREMQKRIKVEIAAIFRNERIVRKYESVFGKKPFQCLTTSVEQEAMLDTLIAERDAEQYAVAE